MSFDDSEVFKLYDKQNKEYNKKLKKKSNFNETINTILNSKLENLKDRCKASDENFPREDTIQNVFKDVEERGMKCCYCGITMVYYIEDAKNKSQQQSNEKYKYIASIEHKTPLSRGGNNTKQNIDFCCLMCNQVKDNMLEEDFKQLISKLSYQDLMNLYITRCDLNRFIFTKIDETRDLRKENNKFEKEFENLKLQIEKLKENSKKDLTYKEHTITQLKSNLSDVRTENTMLRKEIQKIDIDELDDGKTVELLKDNLIMKQREQINHFKHLYESELRIKHIELKILRAKNGKEDN